MRTSRRSLILVKTSLVLILAAGCASPIQPNGSAVVSGSVTASGVSLSSLRVSVDGASGSVDLDASNHFALAVPTGDVKLRFTNASVNATLEIPDVENSETIDVDVTVDATSATAGGLRRDGGGPEAQLDGRVEALPPTTAAGTFTVSGQLVTTDGSTTYVLGNEAKTFTDLAIGQRVHIKGQAVTGGILARIVFIQNTNTEIPVNVNGIVSGFSGSQSDFQFTVNGRLIKGDAQTEVSKSFADLKNGARVEVKGQERNGFVYAVSVHVNKS